MARGISVHVGLNNVNVEAFGNQGLEGCENDARAMREIALSRGFKPGDAKLLLGSDAEFKRVRKEIEDAAAVLQPGDIFLFTFAGHGSRIPDEAEEESLLGEPDNRDEALVLFDRLMLDDFLRRVLWPQFKAGVRIVGVADSCHSATALFGVSEESVEIVEHVVSSTTDGSGVVAEFTSIHTVEHVLHRSPLDHSPGGGTNQALLDTLPGIPGMMSLAEEEVVEVGGLTERALPARARRAHRGEFQAFYEDLHIPSPPAAAPPVLADLLTMAACRDGGKTPDGPTNGAFTRALLDVWNNGEFEGNYRTFMEEIKIARAAPSLDEAPVLTPKVPPAFSSQHPFSI